MMKPSTEAYWQGRSAFEEGKRRDENPYHAEGNLEQHNRWHLGWDDGAQEDEDDDEGDDD